MYQLKKIELKLKTEWAISRNSTQVKENYILSLGEYASEIAPNIRYDEDGKLIEQHFKQIQKAKTMNPIWCNSFQSAVNNVLLKQAFKGDLYRALDLPRVERISTSFSIPIMPVADVADYLAQNSEYHSYKLKISDESSLELLQTVASLTDKPLRVDANEGFKELENFLAFQDKIKDFPIEFIEQPFPVGMMEAYRQLKPQAVFPIMADESVLLDFHGERFQGMFHGINVKIMKARGLENAKKLLLKGKKFGLKTMVGCMIESSLGISEAMSLASLCDYIDLDGALLTANDPHADLVGVEAGYLYLK